MKNNFDEKIFVLYHLGTRFPWFAYQDAEELLKKDAIDKYSLLQIQKMSIETILEDDSEDRYPHKKSYFENLLRDVESKISNTSIDNSAWEEYQSKAETMNSDELGPILNQIARRAKQGELN